MRATVVYSAAIGLCLACASAGTKTGTERQSRSVLTQAQLAATNYQNLYEAIEKLRPDWLTSRGPVSVTDVTPSVPSVFMNGTLLGKSDVLRGMGVTDVTEVRYWEAGPASARFGMGHPRGVIEITRR